jgi:cation diffusion facilitator CzcD-associated flavoprotein CzcO
MDALVSEMKPVETTQAWLDNFAQAMQAQDAEAVADTFQADSHWRDLCAFTWNIQTVSGLGAIEAQLEDTLPLIRPRNFYIPDDRTAPRTVNRAGTDCIEAIIAFETAMGTCNGMVRLVPDPDEPSEVKCWIMMTALDEIRGHEELVGARRPGAESFTRDFGGDNWLDLRNKQRAYVDHEPAVLVVGGGQSGLSIAARLGALGVDTLIIDRFERIGDNWRKRYHALTLHNEVWVNDLPYMPFPPTWPVYIPKDKLANWFESYAESLELNVWTHTEMVGGSYDEAEGKWTIALKNVADGSIRTVRPRHVVYATGVSAIPVMPKAPGLDSFKGEIMHSGKYTNGHAWKGKKALVMGTGNSGHDVAQDLCSSGADVTMIQRSSTHIVSLKQAQRVYSHYFEGPPVEDCDLLATCTAYPVMVKSYQLATKSMKEEDKDLLEGLEQRGFRMDDGGSQATGFQMKYLERGGGYYFNVGASDLIVEGKIKVVQHADMDCFVPEGLQMQDGSVIEADLLVTATGYLNQQDVVRTYMGDEIADRAGAVWGFSEEKELRNMWQRTPQPGLWFTAGGLAQVRIFSKYLALQIKACEVGLLDVKRG